MASNRVLIVDDDVTSRTMLRVMLSMSSYEVVEAADGAAAVEIMRHPDAPRLVILDWLMPKMDGPEVIRELRATPTTRPPYIVMLTTMSSKADIVAGLKAGANDYLTKPFDPGELRARIEVGRQLLDAQETLAAKIEELRHALDHIKTLRGVVPICAWCKKIRDDEGYWKQLESYIRDHTEAEFSHGICPTCAETFHSQIGRATEE
ncbi:MAG: response regulator transcription factor [Acidobacteriota bacterium]